VFFKKEKIIRKIKKLRNRCIFKTFN